MVLTDKDKIIMGDLLTIANEIYKLYRKLEKAKDKRKYTTKILSLIEKEEQLIELLQLDNDKLQAIESIFAHHKININSSLYLATQAIHENKKYPYCRVLVKLRSYTDKDTKNIKIIISEYLTQYEIILLYKHLHNLSYQEPHLFINYYRRIAHILLMEDVEVEKDILKKDMAPIEELFDATELITDYLILEDYFIDKENQKDLNVAREIINLEELKFLRVQMQMLETMSIFEQKKTRFNPDKYVATHSYIVAFISALITFVTKENREGLYKTWASEAASEAQLEYSKRIINTIENELLPSVKKISLVPPIKK